MSFTLFDDLYYYFVEYTLNLSNNKKCTRVCYKTSWQYSSRLITLMNQKTMGYMLWVWIWGNLRLLVYVYNRIEYKQVICEFV